MTQHTHAHDAGLYDTNKKALFFAFLITFSMIIVEIVGGIASGSLALLSDAGHMFTDASALALALFALWFSRRPATQEKTYGFYRMEILSALLNGSLLVIIAGYIFYQGVQRFISPHPVEGGLMLLVAGIGLIANLASAFVLSKGGKDNLNIQGALWHVISDALSSVGVIVGAVIIYFFGIYLVDPVIGFLIGLVILRGAWRLISESVNILLEATPKDIDLEKIQQVIKGQISGVREVHDIHVWTITSGLRALSAHVLVEDIMVSDCGNISRKIKEILRQEFHIEHATIEFECEKCKGQIICPIDKRGK